MAYTAPDSLKLVDQLVVLLQEPQLQHLIDNIPQLQNILLTNPCLEQKLSLSVGDLAQHILSSQKDLNNAADPSAATGFICMVAKLGQMLQAYAGASRQVADIEIGLTKLANQWLEQFAQYSTSQQRQQAVYQLHLPVDDYIEQFGHYLAKKPAANQTQLPQPPMESEEAQPGQGLYC